MNLFSDTAAWLAEHFASGELWLRIGEHMFYTVISVVIAAAIAIPIGYYIGHTGRGREIAVGISGAARALPSFGLILLLISLVGVVQRPIAAFAAFVILAIPSILAGAYAGIQAIDRTTIDSARAIGMTEWQILWKVEAPLGLHLLLGGLRSGTLQVVATVTLSAFINLGGLGYDILQGLPLRRDEQILGAALVVIALALLLDAIFGAVTHIVDRAIPDGTPSRARLKLRTPPVRWGAVVETPTSR
ncbi:MAG: transporter permease subunit [Schumannella sp.]|jgi:osmoprotectant transport system permease protein|nr:transporter permease subunit [Schumannella sp.]